jgi:hypothetical protein
VHTDIAPSGTAEAAVSVAREPAKFHGTIGTIIPKTTHLEGRIGHGKKNCNKRT